MLTLWADAENHVVSVCKHATVVSAAVNGKPDAVGSCLLPLAIQDGALAALFLECLRGKTWTREMRSRARASLSEVALQ